MTEERTRTEGGYTALITAAGCSRRMKTFKPLLPLGEGCILKATVEKFKKAGVDNIIVVVGYKRESLLPLLEELGVQVAVNELYDETDMLQSVKIGMELLPKDCRGMLLCPGDIPLIRPYTIRHLIERHREEGMRVLIPTYRGEMGHPPVFDRSIFKGIRNYPGYQGLRGLLERVKQETVYEEIPDSHILNDTDLPSDYERLKADYAAYEYLTMEECEQWLEFHGTPLKVREHCRAVHKLLMSWKEILEGTFREGEIDWKILENAAMLHDMKKGSLHHWMEGAKILEQMECRKTANVVRCHKRLPGEYQDRVCEESLLYLADRFLQGAQRLTMEEKYRRTYENCKDQPKALESARADYQVARRVAEVLKEAGDYDLF